MVHLASEHTRRLPGISTRAAGFQECRDFYVPWPDLLAAIPQLLTVKTGHLAWHITSWVRAHGICAATRGEDVRFAPITTNSILCAAVTPGMRRRHAQDPCGQVIDHDYIFWLRRQLRVRWQHFSQLLRALVSRRLLPLRQRISTVKRRGVSCRAEFRNRHRWHHMQKYKLRPIVFCQGQGIREGFGGSRPEIGCEKDPLELSRARACQGGIRTNCEYRARSQAQDLFRNRP